jgi:hypothetical protein
MEGPDASAAVGAVVMRLADQIGLTPAGLRDNRWEIEEAPTSGAAIDSPSESNRVPAQLPGAVDPRHRLRVVPPSSDRGGAA